MGKWPDLNILWSASWWATLELTTDSNILCYAEHNILKWWKPIFIVTFIDVGQQLVLWVSGCHYSTLADEWNLSSWYNILKFNHIETTCKIKK